MYHAAIVNARYHRWSPHLTPSHNWRRALVDEQRKRDRLDCFQNLYCFQNLTDSSLTLLNPFGGMKFRRAVALA